MAEIEELKKAASQFDRGKNVLIAADFNESRSGDALKLLESEKDGGSFQDCFSAATSPIPTLHIGLAACSILYSSRPLPIQRQARTGLEPANRWLLRVL